MNTLLLHLANILLFLIFLIWSVLSSFVNSHIFTTQKVSIYRYEISIVDISTLLKNIDIDKDNLENIDINIDKTILENIDIGIDIDKDNLGNIVINIDIDKDYLENIDIDKNILKISISISISTRTFWVNKSFFQQI